MTQLQIAFAAVLTALLCGVVLFTAFAVRAAVALRSSAARLGWIERIGRTTDRDVQRWAFVAHRVTGAAVFAFLLLHVFDVSLFAVSETRFDDVHRLYGSAPMRVFECLLLYAILFHTFNGLRLVALDVVELGAATAKRLLYGAIVATVLAGTAASVVILEPVLS